MCIRDRRLRREKAQLTKERAELAQKAREATSQLRVAKAACKARELHLSASAATKALGDARGAALGRPSSDAVALELKTLQRELAEGTKHALACERVGPLVVVAEVLQAAARVQYHLGMLGHHSQHEGRHAARP